MSMRYWVATRLRYLADRIDYKGAPKAMHYTFTFENGTGIKFREDGKGCRLWYYGDDEYKKAHSESDTEHMVVDWYTLRVRPNR